MQRLQWSLWVCEEKLVGIRSWAFGPSWTWKMERSCYLLLPIVVPYP